MKKIHSSIKPILFFASFVLLAASPLFAELSSYDKYTAAIQDTKSESGFRNVLKHFLVYPFELIRRPVDKGLVVVEKKHLVDKLRWIYDNIRDYGVTPYATAGLFSVDKLGVGADLDFIRMVHRKQDFPDTTFRGWVYLNRDVNFDVGSEIGLKRISGTPFFALQRVQYENRPEEHFYGIGPNTSRGEGSGYRMEKTTVQTNLGYSPDPSLSTDLQFAYKNVNITNGTDGRRGVIDRIFAAQKIAGLSGDDLISVGVNASRDTRNYKENSTAGSLARFAGSFNEGVSKSSEARYGKIELEGSKFFRLGSERRIGVVHFYGEHNNEAPGYEVPFYELAKLGGYGTYPRLSHTLRGYDFNRFTDKNAALLNLEYRYAIWEYRDLRTDAVLFWDEGQVFKNFGQFQVKDFRESYGVGFRFSIAKVTTFLIEAAHGDEGTNFYVKTNTAF